MTSRRRATMHHFLLLHNKLALEFRIIKFYQLQARHPMYYIKLTKTDCQLTSEMGLV